MDNDINQLEVLGSERDVHGVSPEPTNGDRLTKYTTVDLLLTKEKLEWLWSRFNEFPQAWDDYFARNYRAFCNGLGSRDSIFVEVLAEETAIGLVSVNRIIPHHTAELHCVFWDRSFRDREAIVYAIIQRFFKELDLKRLALYIPEPNRPLGKFAKRLGMRYEGTLRRASMYQGQYVNMVAFSFIAEEVNG